MERFLSALMAGLWTGTLAGFGLAYLVWANPGKSSNQTPFAEKAMGEGLAVLGAGILGGFAVCLLVMALFYRFVPPEQLRCSQIVSAIPILALCVSGSILMNRKDPPKYLAYVGLLDIEVRAPKTVFLREKLEDGLIVGISNYLPPDLGRQGKARDEGEFMIKSVSMRAPEHHEWNVTVAANGIDQLWFKLGWPDQPAEAIPWTGWLTPTDKPGKRSEGISVRCRWRLHPVNSTLGTVRKFL